VLQLTPGGDFMKRYLFGPIQSDLTQKMVFIGGPRQVGKTTLSLSLLGPNITNKSPAYLSWDILADRANLLEQKIPARKNLIVLDEIHKYARWRGLIKGLYDKNKGSVNFVVTGSARLDHFSKGGDSLQGRYHYYRLHPLSLTELNKSPTKDDLNSLLELGGFPEPFLSGSARNHRRWQLERNRRVLYEDVRDLETVKDISLIELLMSTLPERVGSPLSIEKIRSLLDSSHQTIDRYIQILERLYVIYRIAPFGAAKIKAVKKEQKLYFWDWTQVTNKGALFENLVASHLLKYCHFIEDTEGYEMDLRYIRSMDKREIDFVVIKDKKPLFAVECKTGERQLSPNIEYFKSRLEIPEVYQVHLGAKDFGDAATTGRVLPFTTFCKELIQF
jgi:predicted AAA+ superfamily ATPase